MKLSIENGIHAHPADPIPETQQLRISDAVASKQHGSEQSPPAPTSPPANLNDSSTPTPSNHLLNDQESSSVQSSSLDTQMAPKRKRASRASPAYQESGFEPPYTAATAEEKRQWKGFCEIESEPAIFNWMLKEFGVDGLKIQEVFGLDPESLSFLPQPVFGLIFLFKYQPDDEGSQKGACPAHVWFANQVSGSSCATTALLNMVYNIDSIRLGDELRNFKNETQSLTPARCGLSVSKFEWVRAIHNSFARKIDMLNYDAVEEDEYGKRHKKLKLQKTTSSRPKKGAVDDSAFHFVSYMPIKNEIWRLDGLDVNPQKLGPCGPDNWMERIAPVLRKRMENHLEFSLLALVKDPYATAVHRLAYNIKFHAAIEARLGVVTEDWRAFADELKDEFIAGLDEIYRITDSILERTEITDTDKARLERYDEADGLLQLRRKNAQEQERLRVTLVAEKPSVEQDEEKAKDRRNDYGPLIQRWLMMLADNGKLRELHEPLV